MRDKRQTPQQVDTLAQHGGRQAVALGYSLESAIAPVVQARGADEVACEMLRVARRYGIPIHQEKTLVDELQTVATDCQIPPSLYERVAEVLVRCASGALAKKALK